MSLTPDEIAEVTDIAARAAREAVLQASQGGLAVPTLRPGTITGWDQDYGSAQVLVDGDSVPISVINALNGVTPTGTRVLVLFEPPHGVFMVNVFGVPYSVSHSATMMDEAGGAVFTSSGSYVNLDLGPPAVLAVTLTKYSVDTAFLVDITANAIQCETPGGGNANYWIGLAVTGPTPGVVAVCHGQVHDDLADNQCMCGQIDFLRGFPIGDYTFTVRHARTGSNAWAPRGSLSLTVAEHPPW